MSPLSSSAAAGYFPPLPNRVDHDEHVHPAIPHLHNQLHPVVYSSHTGKQHKVHNPNLNRLLPSNEGLFKRGILSINYIF